MVALTASPGAPALSRAIVLIGFMGAGKSLSARDAARALGATAVDSDRELERRLGRPLSEEFQSAGEASFRAREEELVCELLDRAAPGSVIALGGGSVTSERVRRALETHLVVLLDVSADDAWTRVGYARGRARRPLAADEDSFRALHAARQPLYAALADAIVPAAERDALATALPALATLAAQPPGTRLLWAAAASGAYPVFLGRGLLGRLRWPDDGGVSRAFCVTDETVAPLYQARLGSVTATAVLPPGEGHKTLASAERVWRAMAHAGITRADHVLALGGGVVGDLAGFCAATYQRGIGVVQLPTTLVAQVDSAYGGKTGVDLPEAKNYVGAYHQPGAVVVDHDVLATLPAAERAAGYAEVLKTALIAGGELWERVATGARDDEGVIFACARTKLAIVAADERDRGRRQVLNLGHTVAHALETAAGYGRWRHGEAVGLGLLAALRISGQDELRAQVRELLAAAGLPIAIAPAELDLDAVLAAAQRDKKRTSEQMQLVVLDAPGAVRAGVAVSASQLRGAVAELGRP